METNLKTFPSEHGLDAIDYANLSGKWIQDFEAEIREAMKTLEHWGGKDCCVLNLRETFKGILGEG